MTLHYCTFNKMTHYDTATFFFPLEVSEEKKENCYLLSTLCNFLTAKNLLSAPEFRSNTEEFLKRFDPKATKGQGPQRLKNLYFTYLVELRALVKAAPYLEEVF